MAGDFDPSGMVWNDLTGWRPKEDLPAPVIHAQGCICPPTSEQTCKNPFCPRGGMQNLKIT